MAIDFKRIKTGDEFELLVRDLFSCQRIEIVSGPGVGADGGADLVIRLPSTDVFQNTTYSKYVVQCKHYAKGGGTVGPAGIADWRDVCDINNANGYFLITSTQPTTKARKMLEEAKGFNNIIWDQSDLAKQIVDCPHYADIVHRYDLQDNFETVFNQAKMMLLGEYKLPFAFDCEVKEKTHMGLIFVKTEMNQYFNSVQKRIGYFCFLNIEDSDYIQESIHHHNLDEINIIDDSKSYNKSVSLSELYSILQSYRDSYYQNELWKCILNNPQNPVGIGVIERSIRNMPYAPKKATIYNLQYIIALDPKDRDNDIYFISEAAKAAAKLDIQTAKAPLISQLKNADQWSLSQTETSLFAQNLISALIELDLVQKAFIDNTFDVFSTIKNEQVKAEIIQYFIKLRVEDKNGLIKDFFEKHKGKKFPARNHGTNYNHYRVIISEQAFPLEIDKLKESYCQSTKQYLS